MFISLSHLRVLFIYLSPVSCSDSTIVGCLSLESSAPFPFKGIFVSTRVSSDRTSSLMQVSLLTQSSVSRSSFAFPPSELCSVSDSSAASGTSHSPAKAVFFRVRSFATISLLCLFDSSVGLLVLCSCEPLNALLFEFKLKLRVLSGMIPGN